MAHRSKPQHHVKTDAGEQQQPLKKSPSRDDPTGAYDKATSPPIHSDTTSTETRRPNTKGAATNTSTGASTGNPGTSPLLSNPERQKSNPKVPPGMNRWDHVETNNGCRRHTVIIS
ncbi:hypothetical protein XANCAGTX0491_001491 [Xanthoria calcicola]